MSERPAAPLRYALYAAPLADAALWCFGADILGYDPATGRDVPSCRPPLDGIDWDAITEEPRRYGFHGTLKAPFRLADGHDEAALRAVCARLAAADRPEIMFVPRVARLGRFVAIVPASPCPALSRLAEDAVRALDPFRAPLSEAERARRNPERLSVRQRALLDAWGYPFVFEEFRFHLTLTGSLPAAVAEPVRGAIERAFLDRRGAALVHIAEIALFRQDAPNERFRIIGTWPLGASPSAIDV